MNVALSPGLQRFVDEQVKVGRYLDGGEVVRQAVRLMEARSVIAGGIHLGAHDDGDIMANAFSVMMEAAKSAREDLKSIMAGVKAINNAKQAVREVELKVKRDRAANWPCIHEDCVLDFSRGMGSERAYHRTRLPHLDPDAPGGVRLVATDLWPGKITRVDDLRLVEDELQTKLDNLSEMGEMESLRLQMVMERVSKFEQMISNMMKKWSEIQAAVIANMK
jgi:Arc/MetJ-type ribon-helix-helix transcriptional regulator